MIAKTLDGCFFFLVFKACDYIWNRIFQNSETNSQISILSSRIDYLEDEIAMIREAIK